MSKRSNEEIALSECEPKMRKTEITLDSLLISQYDSNDRKSYTEFINLSSNFDYTFENVVEGVRLYNSTGIATHLLIFILDEAQAYCETLNGCPDTNDFKFEQSPFGINFFKGSLNNSECKSYYYVLHDFHSFLPFFSFKTEDDFNLYKIFDKIACKHREGYRLMLLEKDYSYFRKQYEGQFGVATCRPNIKYFKLVLHKEFKKYYLDNSIDCSLELDSGNRLNMLESPLEVDPFIATIKHFDRVNKTGKAFRCEVVGCVGPEKNESGEFLPRLIDHLPSPTHVKPNLNNSGFHNAKTMQCFKLSYPKPYDDYVYCIGYEGQKYCMYCVQARSRLRCSKTKGLIMINRFDRTE